MMPSSASRGSPLRAACVTSCCLLSLWCAGAPGRELLPAPLPPLERFEPVVREQLETLANQRDRLLAEGAEPAKLAAAFGELGMHLQAYGLLEAALPCYRNAATLDPTDPRWPHLCGLAEQGSGRDERAIDAFRRAVELDPTEVAARVHLGRLLLDRNQADDARASFESALSLDRSCAACLVGLGRAAALAQRHQEAVEHFLAAAKLAPHADAIDYHLAMSYRALGDEKEAASHLLRRGPTRAGVSDPLLDSLRAMVVGARAMRDRAVAAARTGQLDEAIALLARVIEIDPDDAESHFYLGLARARRGELDAGARSFERALELDPRNERAHLFLGSLESARGRDEQAAAHFERALKLHPGLTVARVELAKTLQRLGRPAEAAERYEEALQADPGNAEARLDRDFSLIAAGRYGDAVERLREDMQVLPDEPAFAHALARLLAAAPEDDLRDGARALELARRLSETVRSVELGETIAMALAELGRFEEAVRWQRLARDEARRLGASARAAEMEANLVLYESRRPCRRPWPQDDAVFVPARGSMAAEPELAARGTTR